MDVPANLRDVESLGACLKLADWRDNKFLGCGAYGSVYRVAVKDHPCDFENVLALKITALSSVKPFDTSRNGTRQREKWLTLLAFNHNHLVRYYRIDIVEEGRSALYRLRFTMEYCSGGTLHDFMEKDTTTKTSFSFSAIMCYGMQIADGLQYLHERQYIHCDIKPQNIFVQRYTGGHPRLLIGDLDDYLQLQYIRPVTDTDTHARGTPRYMSPEMARKFIRRSYQDQEIELGPAADIWSLGCVIRDFVHRHYGISNTQDGLIRNPFQYVKKLIEGDDVPVIDRSIGYRAIAKLVMKCLSEDNSRRPTAIQLKNALLKIWIGAIPNAELAERADLLRHCGNWAQPAVEPCDISPGKILCVHQFFQYNSALVRVRLQLLDITSCTVRKFRLPAHPYGRRYVPNSFVLASRRILCQVRTNSEHAVCGLFVILSFDMDTGTWHTVTTDFEVHQWYVTPVVIMDCIYFWDVGDLKKGKISDFKISLAAPRRPGSSWLLQSASKLAERIWMTATHPDTRVMLCLERLWYDNSHRVESLNTVTEISFSDVILLESRRHCASGVLGEHAYIMGGTSMPLMDNTPINITQEWEAAMDSSHRFRLMQSCVRLDIDPLGRDVPKFQCWPVCSLPKARIGHGAFAQDGRLYVFGGCRLSIDGVDRLPDSVDIYSPQSDSNRSDSWSTVSIKNLDKRSFENGPFVSTSCFVVKTEAKTDGFAAY
ncbi:uncharacterized protein LOC129590010 [Paramacrobiotus metropolitanus]|uniref:uncharacterized protein LOC129590010 n=1 Tax=Paramacrobiotus metropolitanus TaxID=2943436 RepID=UPI00244659AC|nr:uncharacterized protein LOC129590010 [Paramacrobiotus metropolitanus]